MTQDRNVKCNILQRSCQMYIHRNTNRIQNLNMRYTLKEDIQKVSTEAGPHTDMLSTQQHKRKFTKRIYKQLHEKETSNATLFKDI